MIIVFLTKSILKLSFSGYLDVYLHSGSQFTFILCKYDANQIQAVGQGCGDLHNA